MKKNFRIFIILLITFSFTACDDFFITKPDDIYDSEDYVSTFSELYSGFFGLATKVQDIGDHAIFLTELRGDYIEPTENATNEMKDVYNYNSLQGNSFADPKGYYSLIIACNDYIYKAFEYKEKYPEAVNEDHFESLIGGAVRYKVWAYFMLGKIYGKAVYFDEPFRSMQDISQYPVLDLDGILNKCLELMESGINGIIPSEQMNWVEVIDPDHPNEGKYVYYNIFTPWYDVLLADLYLWSGNFQGTYDLILPILNEALIASTEKYAMTTFTRSRRSRFFGDAISSLSLYLIYAIPYDAQNGQTNRILTYFEDIYPCEYKLRPSEYGVERYQAQINTSGSPENPGGDNIRGRGLAYTTRSDGSYKVAQYYSGSSAAYDIYNSDVHINFYRSTDLHFMLLEAMNHLGNWKGVEVLLNQGLQAYDGLATFVTDSSSIFFGFDARWCATNGNLGIRGCANLQSIDLPEEEEKYDFNADRIKIYDLALLDEALLEFATEGKSYMNMIRIAKRYNDWSIVADRVVPKYPESMQAEIRQKIMSGAYFVDWNLNVQ